MNISMSMWRTSSNWFYAF